MLKNPAENLDYLHQMLNGWLLNISPYEHRLGILRVSLYSTTLRTQLTRTGRTLMYADRDRDCFPPKYTNAEASPIESLSSMSLRASPSGYLRSEISRPFKLNARLG